MELIPNHELVAKWVKELEERLIDDVSTEAERAVLLSLREQMINAQLTLERI